MKTLSANEIRQQIKDIWPDVGFVWLVDLKYSIPTEGEIKNFLAQSLLDKQEFIEHKQECDDFALQLHAEAKGFFVGHANYSVAFGECFANRWAGWKNNHNANICICENGIYLIEPQTDETRIANSRTDNLLIVRM